MFEKYNEKARRALFFARYEASKLGSRVIESEHILLGILREGEESVGELLQRFKVRADDLRREIEGERVFVERISSTAELPLSEEAKNPLAFVRGAVELFAKCSRSTTKKRVEPCSLPATKPASSVAALSSPSIFSWVFCARAKSP